MSNIPMPLNDPIARPRRKGLKPSDRDPNEGTLTETWVPYMQSQNNIASTSIQQTTPPVVLTAQSASIAVTAIPSTSLPSGLYRVSYYARITTPATVSSSLIVSFLWNDGAIACSLSAGAIIGNTVATVGTSTAVIRIDAAPVSFSTTYLSVGATSMAYALSVVLETL